MIDNFALSVPSGNLFGNVSFPWLQKNILLGLLYFGSSYVLDTTRITRMYALTYSTSQLNS